MVETLAGAAAAAGGAMAWAVRAPQSSLLAPSIYRGVSNRRSIALTFDDGPSESTGAVLDLLARYGARATFFQCGANVKRLPEMARRVAEAGHQIGNHTVTHPKFHFKPSGFIRGEVAGAQKMIEDGAGVSPRLFRAPYGIRWFGLRAAQAEFGLLGVMWTCIALDWKLDAGAIAERLLRQTAPGAIFCLHDGRAISANPDISSTIGALERVLPEWVKQGFQFETVSQILCPTN